LKNIRMNSYRKLTQPWSGEIHSGFSLVELLVALIVVSVLVAMAAPSLQSFLANTRVAGQANDLTGAINLARSEAVRTNSGVTLCKSADGATCATTGTDWAIGWIVFNDPNFNGTVDTGETVIRVFPALSGNGTAVASSGMANNIIFTGMGHPVPTFSGASTKICPATGVAQSACRTICVNSQGRPRVDTPAQLTADTLCGN
jgi:type IV fimbrial biogenesis protein FimT